MDPSCPADPRIRLPAAGWREVELTQVVYRVYQGIAEATQADGTV